MPSRTFSTMKSYMVMVVSFELPYTFEYQPLGQGSSWICTRQGCVSVVLQQQARFCYPELDPKA